MKLSFLQIVFLSLILLKRTTTAIPKPQEDKAEAKEDGDEPVDEPDAEQYDGLSGDESDKMNEIRNNEIEQLNQPSAKPYPTSQDTPVPKAAVINENGDINRHAPKIENTDRDAVFPGGQGAPGLGINNVPPNASPQIPSFTVTVSASNLPPLMTPSIFISQVQFSVPHPEGTIITTSTLIGIGHPFPFPRRRRPCLRKRMRQQRRLAIHNAQSLNREDEEQGPTFPKQKFRRRYTYPQKLRSENEQLKKLIQSNEDNSDADIEA